MNSHPKAFAIAEIIMTNFLPNAEDKNPDDNPPSSCPNEMTEAEQRKVKKVSIYAYVIN